MQRFARRKWGWWLVLWRKPRFKVKLLRFKKGQSISLQRHQWRNELWLFLGGLGDPLLGYGKAVVSRPCRRGDCLLIEKMKWHKFTATKPTWVLEIQFGDLCVEKDIERKDG